MRNLKFASGCYRENKNPIYSDKYMYTYILYKEFLLYYIRLSNVLCNFVKAALILNFLSVFYISKGTKCCNESLLLSC